MHKRLHKLIFLVIFALSISLSVRQGWYAIALFIGLFDIPIIVAIGVSMGREL